MELLASWPFKIGIFCALLIVRLALTAAQSSSRPGQVNEKTGDANSWVETTDSLLLTIGLVFFVVQPFILQPFYIPSGSMENTLQWTPIQDRLLVSKAIYYARDPIPGDVVVFRPPPAAQVANPSTNLSDDFIKRCIGAPGDVVYANSSRTYFRNGKLLVEPYVKWSPPITPDGYRHSFSYDMKIVDGKVYSREYAAPGVPDQWQSEGVPTAPEEQSRISAATPEAIPAGHFLMLGDHRNNSSDGHVWGFVPRENVVGKAMCVFWPLSRAGTLDRMSHLDVATLQASHLVPPNTSLTASSTRSVATQ